MSGTSAKTPTSLSRAGFPAWAARGTGGVNGASPGIVMKAHPMVGNFYRQEFLLNTAEDAAGVLNLDQAVKVPTVDLVTGDSFPLVQIMK